MFLFLPHSLSISTHVSYSVSLYLYYLFLLYIYFPFQVSSKELDVGIARVDLKIKEHNERRAEIDSFKPKHDDLVEKGLIFSFMFEYYFCTIYHTIISLKLNSRGFSSIPQGSEPSIRRTQGSILYSVII